MFEAYKVGVTLALKNEVGAGLRSITEQFIALDKMIGGVQERLLKLGETPVLPQAMEGFSKANLDAQALDARLRELQRTMRSINETSVTAKIREEASGSGHSTAKSLRHEGHQQIFDGMMYTALGVGMLDTFKSPFEKAMDMARVTASMQQKGLDPAQIAAAMSVVSTSRSLSQLDTAKIMDEALGAFRETGKSGAEALRAASIMTPVLADYSKATGLLSGEKQEVASQNMMQLMKFIEMSGGALDVDLAKRLTDTSFKLAQSSGHLVTNRDLMQARAQANTFWSIMSPENFLTSMAQIEPIMGEKGGSKFGTGFNQMFSRAMGTNARLPSLAGEEFIRLGWWNRNEVEKTNGGYRAKAGHDPLTGAMQQAMEHGTVLDMLKVMRDTFAAHGIKSQADIAREASILGSKTGGDFISMGLRQIPLLEESFAANNKALGVSGILAGQSGTAPDLLFQQQQEWANLQTEYGKTILPLEIEGMKTLIPLLKDLTGWVQSNPETVRGMAEGFAYMGGALTLFGAGSMAAGGLKMLTGQLGDLSTVAKAGPGIAGDLGKIGTALNALGAIAAAGAVGWAAGKVINGQMNDDIHDESGGRWHNAGEMQYDKTHTPDGKFNWWKWAKFEGNVLLNRADAVYKHEQDDADAGSNYYNPDLYRDKSLYREGRQWVQNAVQPAPKQTQTFDLTFAVDGEPLAKKLFSVVDGHISYHADPAPGMYDASMFAPSPRHQQSK